MAGIKPPPSRPPRRKQSSGARLHDRAEGRPRVLIVEDHDDTRGLFAWCMAAGGWRVEAVADGDEALLVATTFEPDAVILDLQLPTVGGVALARALRRSERLRGVRLVACTAHVHLLGDGSVRTDFDALVAKPCDPEALRAIVERLVGVLPGSPES